MSAESVTLQEAVAHLPVRETEGKIDLTYALQCCVRRAWIYRQLGMITKISMAVGGVFILVLIRLWEPSAGASTRNAAVVYGILAVASIISLMSTLTSVLNFDREGGKYETASRAVRRMRDRYEFEIKRNISDAGRRGLLEVWAKDHIYKIETLLEEGRVYDVDFHFQISDLEDHRD